MAAETFRPRESLKPLKGPKPKPGYEENFNPRDYAGSSSREIEERETKDDKAPHTTNGSVEASLNLQESLGSNGKPVKAFKKETRQMPESPLTESAVSAHKPEQMAEPVPEQEEGRALVEEYRSKQLDILTRQEQALEEGDAKTYSMLEKEAEEFYKNYQARLPKAIFARVDSELDKATEERIALLNEKYAVTKGAILEGKLEQNPVTLIIGDKKDESTHNVVVVVEKFPVKKDASGINFEKKSYVISNDDLQAYVAGGLELKGILTRSQRASAEPLSTEQRKDAGTTSLETNEPDELEAVKENKETNDRADRIQKLLKELEPKGKLAEKAESYLDKYRKLGFKTKMALSLALLGGGLAVGGVMGGSILLGRRALATGSTALGVYETINLLRDQNFSKKLEKSIKELEKDPEATGLLGQQDANNTNQIDKIDDFIAQAVIRGGYGGKNQTELEQDPVITKLLDLRDKMESRADSSEERLRQWSENTDVDLRKYFKNEKNKRKALKAASVVLSVSGQYAMSSALEHFSAAESDVHPKPAGSDLPEIESSSDIGQENPPLAKSIDGIKQPEIKPQFPTDSEALRAIHPENFAGAEKVLEVGNKGVIGTLKNLQGSDPENYSKMMNQLRELYSSDTAGANNHDDAILTRFAIDYEQSHPGDLDRIAEGATIKLSPEGFPTLENVEYLYESPAVNPEIPPDPSLAEAAGDIPAPEIETGSYGSPLDTEIIGEPKQELSESAADSTIKGVVESSTGWNVVDTMQERWGSEFTEIYLNEEIGASAETLQEIGKLSIRDFMSLSSEEISQDKLAEYQNLKDWLTAQNSTKGWTEAQVSSKPVGQAVIDAAESLVQDFQEAPEAPAPTHSTILERHLEALENPVNKEIEPSAKSATKKSGLFGKIGRELKKILRPRVKF